MNAQCQFGICAVNGCRCVNPATHQERGFYWCEKHRTKVEKKKKRKAK